MRKPGLVSFAAVSVLLSSVAGTGIAVAQDGPAAGRFMAQYGGPDYYPGGPGMYGPGMYGGGYMPGGYMPGGYMPGGYMPGGYMQGGDMQGPGRGYYPGARRQARVRGTAGYHGFRIKLAHSARSADGARELAVVERQIDIVQRAGLSGADMRRFRHNAIGFSERSNAKGGHSVALALAHLQPNDSRPILLHEYMHVYHSTRLPGGYANPTIRGFYQEALASGAYPQGSYMLSNVREYFAMTASCYLNGTVARPPYNRETIRAAQPGYYAYLERLFGPRG